MKVLVTGAGGFTGRVVARHLAAHGYTVRGLVRNELAVAELRSFGVEPVLGDLTDRSSLEKAVAGIDKIIHIAALFRQAGVPSTEFHRVNVEGTQILLEAAVNSRVQTFIHCSTVGVHGHIKEPPGNEETSYNPGDAYQQSKVDAEQLVLSYLRNGRIRGSIIRPAMIYGPHDKRTLKLFKRIAERRFFYVGAGTSLVHFIDVRDLAEAFRLAAERPDVNGEIFIIAGKTSLPLRELVTIITSLMGVPEPRLHLPVKPMQVLGSLCEAVCTPLHLNPPIFRRRVDFFTKDRSFDCKKAATKLGFRSSQSLIEELSDIIASYIVDGSIDGERIKKPSAIVRALSGQIHAWDSQATETYGWSRDQVVGNISHSVLSTRFPTDLNSINSHLEKQGEWEGKLIHCNKHGEELYIQSKWRLLNLPDHVDPLVLELNHLLDSDKPRLKGKLFLNQAMAGWASVVGGAI